MDIIKASEFFRKEFSRRNGMKKNKGESFVKEISEMSREILSKDPEVNINYILSKNITDKGKIIIEGIRNPYEFSRFFRVNEDMVVILNRKDLKEEKNIFASGVEIIQKMLD